MYICASDMGLESTNKVDRTVRKERLRDATFPALRELSSACIPHTRSGNLWGCPRVSPKVFLSSARQGLLFLPGC